jgi:hypothetical protein
MPSALHHSFALVKVLSEIRAKSFMVTMGQKGGSLRSKCTEARSPMAMAKARSSMAMAKAKASP